jgi:hypothetical protein
MLVTEVTRPVDKVPSERARALCHLTNNLDWGHK